MTFSIPESFIFFGLIAITTMLTRILPFLVFPENKKVPKYITYLGEVLPYTIIAMMVIYCIKDVSFVRAPFGVAEVISIGVLGALHFWKKNTLLSIGVGTILYMILTQFVL